jgi:hypothetical protein
MPDRGLSDIRNRPNQTSAALQEVTLPTARAGQAIFPNSRRMSHWK